MSVITDPDYMPSFSEPTPSSITDEARAFVANFYRISDMQVEDEQWAEFFTGDAQVIMGEDSGRGHCEIKELRRRMWINILARKHQVLKVFTGAFSENSGTEGEFEYDMMLLGRVQRTSQDSKTTIQIPWASHMVLKKGPGREASQWKLAHYRVWL
ncbi:hypothetical protein MANI_026064 [Metarhizium anisopliae]|nr:hypothetical protein MANI_026064 [Metarhizium anisopliae]